MLTKIMKAEAKKRYNANLPIILNPSKMRPFGVWNMAMETTKEQTETQNHGTTDFDTLCYNFSYYNCTNETGKVIHFYKR